MDDSAPVKTYSFGGCDFNRVSPALEKLSPATKKLNIVLTFESAMKLGLAIDECVRKLNSYNRSTKAGKQSALNLCVHLDLERVTVNEAKVDV